MIAHSLLFRPHLTIRLFTKGVCAPVKIDNGQVSCLDLDEEKRKGISVRIWVHPISEAVMLTFFGCHTKLGFFAYKGTMRKFTGAKRGTNFQVPFCVGSLTNKTNQAVNPTQITQILSSRERTRWRNAALQPKNTTPRKINLNIFV